MRTFGFVVTTSLRMTTFAVAGVMLIGAAYTFVNEVVASYLI